MQQANPRQSITLTIARKGVAKPIVIKLVRDIIKIQSVKSKSLGDGLAYIRISQFQERTATDVADALAKLNKEKPLKGVVLDLRNNSGGLLNAAIGVSAAFIKPGSLVVSTRAAIRRTNASSTPLKRTTPPASRARTTSHICPKSPRRYPSLSSSIQLRHPPRKSSPAHCRIINAPPSWAHAASVKAAFRPSSRFG